MTGVDFRAASATLMRAILADEAAHLDWTYDAVRPMVVPPSWKPGQKVRGDCSKGAQFINRWLDLPDPMGMNYGPFGNSQTLCLKLQHLDAPEELLVGDAVTFGEDGEEHAARVLVASADPLLWSFGHQGAPNSYPLSADGRPAQYLRVPMPVFVPTPADLLRAKTGWFSWVAWRLSEGDWRDRKLADPTVRPDVPQTIPGAWWTRLAAFEANRNHGNPKGTN